VKKLGLFLPLLGVGWLVVALGLRACQRPGLSLQPFSEPPAVNLPRFDVAAGDSALSGEVHDAASGAPVAEALVFLELGEEPLWMYSDEHGRFALDGVPAGAHALSVLARKFQPQDFGVVAPDGGLSLGLEHPFGPAPGLPPIERETLRGAVVPAIPGQGLLGYELWLEPARPPDAFGAPVPRRATIGADRGFELSDLILGDYRLHVLPPWAAGGTWPDLLAPERRDLTHARGAAERRLELSIAAGDVRAILTDLGGAPVQGALILVRPRDDERRVWPPARSGADGSFRMRDLPPGAYRVTVRAGAAEVSRVVEVGAGTTLGLDLPPLDLRGEQ